MNRFPDRLAYRFTELPRNLGAVELPALATTVGLQVGSRPDALRDTSNQRALGSGHRPGYDASMAYWTDIFTLETWAQAEARSSTSTCISSRTGRTMPSTS